MSTTDEKIKGLFALLEAKRKEIKKIERPTWVTNCSFSYNADRGGAINLHVIADEVTLTEMLAFLIQKEDSFIKAASILGVKGKFKWLGYTVNEWTEDIKMRLNIIDVKKKKDQLAEMEAKLSALVSPEERRRMEVEALSAELLGDE